MKVAKFVFLKQRIVRVLIVVFIMLAISEAVFYYYSQSATQISEEVKVEQKILEISSEALYIDEVLTQSARLYIYSQDSMWFKRYEKAEKDWKEVLSTVKPMISDSIYRAAFDPDNITYKELYKDEYESFALLSRGQRDSAIALLQSDRYIGNKKVLIARFRNFQNNSKEGYAAIQKSFDDIISTTELLRDGFTFVLLIVFVVMVGAFYYLVKLINKLIEVKTNLQIRNKELINSENKITKLNEGLEKKVEERTNELRLQNEIITKKNKENELLLSEIHHRVKNNLVTVKSLIGLQKHRSKDSEVIKVFTECENRILGMSRIHQMISESEDFTTINTKKYIEGLVKELIENLFIEVDVDLKTNVQEVNLNSTTIVSLGLIISELISNISKHAFNNTTKGVVEVSLKKIEKNRFLLIVKDNGEGILPSRGKKKASLGSMIVEAYVEKINGSIIIESDNGVEVKVEFEDVT